MITAGPDGNIARCAAASPGAQAVIFDLGGVALHWTPLQLLRRLYPDADEARRMAVRQAVFEHPAWLDLDRGTLTHAAAIPRFAARLGCPEAEIARRLGLHAVAFESAAQCAAELRPWLAAGA